MYHVEISILSLSRPQLKGSIVILGPGQIWYLIVSIPDLCLPLYFDFENDRFKTVVMLFLNHCFMYLPVSIICGGSVFGFCFVMHYLLTFLVLQSS